MIDSLYKQTLSFIEECKISQRDIKFFDEKLKHL